MYISNLKNCLVCSSFVLEQQIYNFAAQVSLVYAVTLSIFPGAISQDLHSRIFDDGW